MFNAYNSYSTTFSGLVPNSGQRGIKQNCPPNASALHLHRFRAGGSLPPDRIFCDACQKPVWPSPWFSCMTCKPLDSFDLCVSCALQIQCDNCLQPMTAQYYHCPRCNDGNLDVCQSCAETGVTCYQIMSKAQSTSSSPMPDLSGLSLGTPPTLYSSFSSPTGRTPSPLGGMGNGGTENSQPNKGEEKDKDMAMLQGRLSSTIMTEKPNVKWDDVAGLDGAKEELQESIILPMRFPELFTGKRKARRGILLYGPPGTGKSYLAKAVATEVDCTLFSISSSDIFSKWMGESEKLVKLLFEQARKKKPAVIFIDEIEALCGKRGGESNEDSDRVKTEFLVQMDGVGNDTSGIVVLGATNLPWQLDAAIRRRFQRRIHIGLPEFQARLRAFQIHMGSMGLKLSSHDYSRLASMTEGFSGSDIANVVQDALMMPVKKIHTSTYYRKVVHNGTEKFTPCTRLEAGAMLMNWRQVPAGKMLEPPLQVEEVFAVLKNFKSSVSKEDVKKAKEWTEEFGSEGA